MASSKPTATKYKGGNETIDRLIAEHWPDMTLYMVNGPGGRRPVPAPTREEALAIYREKHKSL